MVEETAKLILQVLLEAFFTWTGEIVQPLRMKRTLMTAILTLPLLTTTAIFAGEPKPSNSTTYKMPLGNTISLELTVADFQARKHKITECQILDWSGVCLIDDKPFFGTDWELPTNQLVKATVKIGIDTINLDVSCMYNPWIGNPNPQLFTAEKVEGGHLIKGNFSDGAGSYEAEWLIIKKSSIRTRLTKKEC